MIELRTLNGQYTIQQLLYRKIQDKFKKKPCSSNIKGVPKSEKKWEARIWNSKTRKNESLGIFNTQTEAGRVVERDQEINAENDGVLLLLKIFETFYQEKS